MNEQLRVGPDGIARCWWPGADERYVAYHDDEWGRPVVDDRRLFEKLCLEGFQSGLSWITILRKRESFRRAFVDFDPLSVAQFSDDDIERLMSDASIVRHRGKIEATVNNARRYRELVEHHGSLAAFVWSFEDEEPKSFASSTSEPYAIRSTSPASERLSKALKKQGWRFVGPTTVYAFMQAMGLVNDHVSGCRWRGVCAEARSSLVRPAGRL